MSDEATNNLANKIAQLLQAETPKADFYSLQKSIEKINQRLDGIESKIESSNMFSPLAIGKPQSFHPSQEKFDVAEIIADEKMESSNVEKPCPYEPTGKPCDHCSMCNSRGF